MNLVKTEVVIPSGFESLAQIHTKKREISTATLRDYFVDDCVIQASRSLIMSILQRGLILQPIRNDISVLLTI